MARSEEFPQLAAQGLKACPIRGDGNCLFNALSDQVHGDQSRHEEIRMAAINYMTEHPSEFQPFVPVDGERRNPKRKVTRSTSNTEAATGEQTVRAWEDYLKNMRKGGTWGGQVEIIAFMKAYDMDVQVFEADKILYLRARDDKIARPVVYVAYHAWEHYSSIRNIDGPFTGPPEVKPKFLSVDEDVDSGYLSSNPPSPGSYSQSGSSIERDLDSDDEDTNGPSKRRDRRMSRASKASYQSMGLEEDDVQIPTIELTEPESTVSSHLPSTAQLPTLSKLPPNSELPVLSADVESNGKSSDDESASSRSGSFSFVSTPRIKINFTNCGQINGLKAKQMEHGPQKKKSSARDMKDLKKAAQKRARKEAKRQLAATTSNASITRIPTRDSPPLEQVIGMKMLYI
ncbi:OTU domain-containing 3 [Hyphodiscus hymeniophilus]|uniref:OTU domain-containing 3 n=1 Tax=Hyphodiscus hymeniophilus TaxID=353542 RepID=A0A9P6VR52_9HELO|nr:OTU domain-containing 3 [Hyphodiscus hymeniophilus]